MTSSFQNLSEITRSPFSLLAIGAFLLPETLNTECNDINKTKLKDIALQKGAGREMLPASCVSPAKAGSTSATMITAPGKLQPTATAGKVWQVSETALIRLRIPPGRRTVTGPNLRNRDKGTTATTPRPENYFKNLISNLMTNEKSKHTLTMISRSEVINTEVKQHSCSLNSNDWHLAERTQNLYRVSEVFNNELFDGFLSTLIITISSLRITTLGCFVIGRNEFGAKNHIKLNAKHLNRSKIEVYRTLLHEMLHQSEYEIHKKKPNRGNYHSFFFQSLARNLGIPTDYKGVSLGIIRNSPFTDVLRKHNLIQMKELDENVAQSIHDTNELILQQMLPLAQNCSNLVVHAQMSE